MNRVYVRYPEYRRKALTLSYDDGVVQDRRLIETIEKAGLKCTFNINGYRYMEKETWENINFFRPGISREEAPELYKNHEVAVHGFYHPWLDRMPEGNAAWEIVKDREMLEEVFGTVIRGMAYPMGGTQSDYLVNVLKSCGIQYARTTKASYGFEIPQDWLRLPPTLYHLDARREELTEKFLESVPDWQHVKMFYMWGHSYEFDEISDWKVLDEFCEQVKGRDDIWYATNGEIISYLQAADRLVTSVDGKIVYNPTATPIWLEAFHTGERRVLGAGETWKFEDRV